MATMHRGAESYLRTKVESSTPLELVVLLYEGAIRFTREAQEAAARRDIAARGMAVSRALAILAELQSTLDLEKGGEIAASLQELYAFVSHRLIDGSMRQEPGPFEEALKVLETLRDGWSTVAAPQMEPVGTR